MVARIFEKTSFDAWNSLQKIRFLCTGSLGASIGRFTDQSMPFGQPVETLALQVQQFHSFRFIATAVRQSIHEQLPRILLYEFVMISEGYRRRRQLLREVEGQILY